MSTVTAFLVWLTSSLYSPIGVPPQGDTHDYRGSTNPQELPAEPPPRRPRGPRADGTDISNGF